MSIRQALAGAALAVLASTATAGRHAPPEYGPVEVYEADRPVVIHREPVLVDRHGHAHGAPLYLHVPPGHAKHWSRHCAKYQACDRPVLFVDERWYREVYRGRGHRG